MLTVADLMTSDVFALGDQDTLLTARSIMTLAKIRHIPIVDSENRFAGLLTHRDILNASVSRFAEIDQQEQDELDAGIPIREIMRTDVKTVTPDMHIKEAARLLLEHKYGCLPVLAGEQLVGIVTEADFLALTISLMETLEEEGKLD
ncbi:MAG: CBS domain-containing protein [Desulfovibrionales bacterium]